MLHTISEHDYLAGDPSSRIIHDDHAHRFAELQLPEAPRPLLLAWPSELVDPVVVDDPVTGDTWVGVDERLVCVSRTGAPRFSIGLPSPLLDIAHSDDGTVALCEVQVIAVNNDYSIRAMLDLPDVATSVMVEDGKLVVGLLDGGEHVIPY